MIREIISEQLQGPVDNAHILDIGCGNGEICRYFMNANKVAGVDIEDKRRPGREFTFKLVDSAKLPFNNDEFDIVISNHTIEHIPEQGEHLDEIKRVLKRGGIVYLATPNKSSPIMEGHIGNPYVLRYKQMAPLFREHGFEPIEKSVQLIKNPAKYSAEFKYAKWLPIFILKPLRRFFPSHVYILKLK
ncbi:MAG: class I SAM-dependent methyltransferase [Candidatus Paceibacterota bacterium]